MNENDLRVIKTKRALSKSFYTLLESKMFSSISVNQICENALIHRTTFYKHFYDKYDLLIYLITDLTKDYFSIDLKERINSPFSTMEQTINNIHELKKIGELQQGDKEFERTTGNHFIKIIQKDIKQNVHRIEVDASIPEDLIFYIYGSSLFGIMEWTRDNEMNCSAQTLDAYFHKLINIKIKE
ncbi:TetR/AcrR family transcriptional regulator [Staphylococcus sp. ACRSN]|uniref:TetR/AcrR family transcriptional regulator n=1 Tax=Staphylococcus sp. ACRSN TaxID=2918214 RepID=UPI001EF3B864|nr:TetR/AcrR family transcriptional regulator [Staphylococcus sp. ACRSN]MCG7339031.1 TetR/AcrR family transcriptional regulator [Staphylococcus sp. ACRSN]